MSQSQWIKRGLLAFGAVALGYGVARALRHRTTSFQGKVVLITGGARGLGLVLARRLGAEGARIVICSRNTEQLERARDDLCQRNIEVLALTCDVTDRAAVHRMVQEIEAHWGTVDVAVNNAGVIQMGPFDSLTERDFEVAMKTHFWGPLNVMLEVLPAMRARHSGRILNIASIGGKVSMPHLVPYNASKFALVGLSEGLAAELAQDGIHVTTICPGLMRTGSPRNAVFKGRHQAEYAWFSILDSLPIFSMSAERAADQIIDAARAGRAVSILGLPAKLAAMLHDAFPDFTVRLLGRANRYLPSFGGIGTSPARGAESHSSLSPSLLTHMTEQAAIRNNEL